MKAFFVAIVIVILCVTSGCYRQIERSLYAGQQISSKDEGNRTEEPTDRKKQRMWKKGYVYVTKVIDGDTFWVDDGSKAIKVRFIGIDAPETRNTGHKKKGHFGVEAKEYVTRLTKFQWVRLQLDIQEKDQYQRLLAYVYLQDGTFLNAHLIESGYAVLDTHPPNVKYADLFSELQHRAKQEKLGLWNSFVIKSN